MDIMVISEDMQKKNVRSWNDGRLNACKKVRAKRHITAAHRAAYGSCDENSEENRRDIWENTSMKN